MALKDFAVEKGYNVPDKLLREISDFEAHADSATLDRLVVELTQITYPITTLNIDRVQENAGVTKFVYLLLALGFVAAIISGYFAYVIKQPGDGSWHRAFAEPALALCLGIVGAIVYVMMPNGRLNVVLGLDAENIANNMVRVVLGGLLGFVLYIAGATMSSESANKINWTLLLPLLGGYSITLVVGILAKAVAAAQLTFNIDDKSVRASLQK
jgi:hypothetical protein